jgi:hypothetical protein
MSVDGFGNWTNNRLVGHVTAANTLAYNPRRYRAPLNAMSSGDTSTVANR